MQTHQQEHEQEWQACLCPQVLAHTINMSNCKPEYTTMVIKHKCTCQPAPGIENVPPHCNTPIPFLAGINDLLWDTSRSNLPLAPPVQSGQAAKLEQFQALIAIHLHKFQDSKTTTTHLPPTMTSTNSLLGMTMERYTTCSGAARQCRKH